MTLPAGARLGPYEGVPYVVTAPVATLQAAWVAGMSVSPDGRTVLYRRSTLASDLTMIENFR